MRSKTIIMAACIIFPRIAGASICEQSATQKEEEFGIPNGVLTGIVRTESSSHPWTVNSQGKGYFFDSKEEAIKAVGKLQESGVRSIDVGCAQINLRWHSDAFDSLDEAFDPAANLTYASSFLTELHSETNDWRSAVGDYHSRTQDRGAAYAEKVFSKMNASAPIISTRSALGFNENKAKQEPKRIVWLDAVFDYALANVERKTSKIGGAIGNLN